MRTMWRGGSIGAGESDNDNSEGEANTRMNRLFKFRAQGRDTADWYYGYYFVDKYGEPSILELDGRKAFVNPKTVGQFTGLKDGEGGDICEGDIIQAGDATLEVQFKDGGFIAQAAGRQAIPRYWDSYKIIGNIYENPELLNG